MIYKFKLGELGVIFFAGEPSLLIEVMNRQGPNISGVVINGLWEFTLNTVTGDAEYDTPWGVVHASGWVIYPLEFFHTKTANYNELFYAIKASGFKPTRLSSLRLRWLRSAQAVTTLTLRLPDALRAFMKVLREGTPPAPVRYEDDEIPF